MQGTGALPKMGEKSQAKPQGEEKLFKEGGSLEPREKSTQEKEN